MEQMVGIYTVVVDGAEDTDAVLVVATAEGRDEAIDRAREAAASLWGLLPDDLVVVAAFWGDLRGQAITRHEVLSVN